MRPSSWTTNRPADRAAAARDNLARLGLEAEHLVADLTDLPEVEPAPYVMLDAPCSGTGTLRGNPEIKLRITPASVEELATLQRRMILTASELVAPGGVLLYAVCSLTDAEGPAVARYLLERPEVAGRLAPDARLQVVTSLEAKGMEYDGVVLVEPAEIKAQPAGTATLYVALSRATQRLITVATTSWRE